MQIEGNEADRKFDRVFFTTHDSIVGVVSFTANGVESASVRLMNMSEGGVCVSCRKGRRIRPKKGDRLSLKKIEGIGALEGVADIQMEIRWLFDNPLFENIEMGCMFLDLPEDLRTRIRSVVETGILL